MIPAYFRSDGEWVWNAAFEHYISNYQLAPPQEFLDPSRQLILRSADRPTRSCEALSNSLPGIRTKFERGEVSSPDLVVVDCGVTVEDSALNYVN